MVSDKLGINSIKILIKPMSSFTCRSVLPDLEFVLEVSRIPLVFTLCKFAFFQFC